MTHQRQTGAESVHWDLGDLYPDVDDPSIDRDLERLVAMAKRFYDDHAGKLAATLGAALDTHAQMTCLADQLFIYLFLRRSTDATNERIQQRIGTVQEAWSRASADYLTFFEHELVAIDDATYTAALEQQRDRRAAPPVARPHPRESAVPACRADRARVDVALAVRSVRVVRLSR